MQLLLDVISRSQVFVSSGFKVWLREITNLAWPEGACMYVGRYIKGGLKVIEYESMISAFKLNWLRACLLHPTSHSHLLIKKCGGGGGRGAINVVKV